MNKETIPILANKYYNENTVFLPENLLREARRQKNRKEKTMPSICLFDPDGDLANYLIRKGIALKSDHWACYHSTLYVFQHDNYEIGILPCVVGSSYAVLVAEELFVSGCRLLISITSAGIIKPAHNLKQFTLITSSVRDEGTSYHYLPADKIAALSTKLFNLIARHFENSDCPFFPGTSWTTDAPFRETASSIDAMKKLDIACVEMEAAALYALADVKKIDIICFAHLTNSMAQAEGDFEKGEESGSVASLNLISYLLKILQSEKYFKD